MDGPVSTGDGSITRYSETYGEHYHSLTGAATEAREKFAVPALITTGIIERPSLTVLDIGFGLGYNAAAAYAAVRSGNPAAHCAIDSIELDASVLSAAKDAHADDNDAREFIGALADVRFFSGSNTDALLYIGDARSIVPSLERQYDAVFLDAFSTKKNTELWTYDFFLLLKERLLPHGVIVTYSAAYPVISAFHAAGFFVRQTTAVGRATGGTIAMLEDRPVFTAVDEHRDRERRATTGILYYRDETLTASGDAICARYEAEKAALTASGVPSIKKYRKTDGASDRALDDEA